MDPELSAKIIIIVAIFELFVATSRLSSAGMRRHGQPPHVPRGVHVLADEGRSSVGGRWLLRPSRLFLIFVGRPVRPQVELLGLQRGNRRMLFNLSRRAQREAKKARRLTRSPRYDLIA